MGLVAREAKESGGIHPPILLSKGKEAIEKELYSKLPYLLPQGGYIPSIDHVPPPDISLENWKYYAQLKKKLIQEFSPKGMTNTDVVH